MLSTPWRARKDASERAAAQAWDYLTAAVAAAGDSARHAGRAAGEGAKTATRVAGEGAKTATRVAGRRGARLADGTGGRVSSVADEAWRRANAALDALAGRRPTVPWGLLALAGVAGVAVGFAVAASLRTAVNRAARQPAEFEPAPPPTTEQVHLDAE